MSKFQHVNNVARKERLAINNKYEAVKRNRINTLRKLAKEADDDIRRQTDRRLKHNRGKKHV